MVATGLIVAAGVMGGVTLLLLLAFIYIVARTPRAVAPDTNDGFGRRASWIEHSSKRAPVLPQQRWGYEVPPSDQVEEEEEEGGGEKKEKLEKLYEAMNECKN